MSVGSKINRLKETKTEIGKAITEKGGSVSSEDTFFSYADKIRQIKRGGGATGEDWQPEPDWWDIKTILENDTENYSQKIICLLTDELDDGATTNIVKGGEKYKLSDGQTISHSSSTNLDITNLFDVSKDKVCSKGYKTRYIIYYSNSDMAVSLPDNVIYVIFDNVKFSNACFENKNLLEGIEFLNDTKYTSTNAFRMFLNCSSLQQLPNLDTSNITNMDSMFYNCSSLRKIPNLDTSKVTNMFGMFSGCSNLKQIPNLETNNVNIMNYMFYNCNNLKQLPNLDTTNVSTMDYMFYCCYGLRYVKKMNMSNVVSMSYIFGESRSLIDIQFNGEINANLSIENSSKLSHNTLVNLIDNLKDLTGQTVQTLTLGATNLAKLTDEEKAMATNKNWTLS